MNASAFANSTNVFLPFYRQAGLKYAGEIWKRDGNIDSVISDIPYADITSALDYYFKNYNNGRPFILASHSHGSAIAKLMLKKSFKDHCEYYKSIVAAYVIGFAVTKDDFKINPHWNFAKGESDADVIISWNTEGKLNFEENVTTCVLYPNAISINPMNWKLDGTYAPASENLGSLMLNEKTNKFEIAEVGADAKVIPEHGVVLTNAELSDIASEFFGSEGRHESDYTFYYNNIKANYESQRIYQ